MKVCYVLPQYFHNSAENFFHIINFLEELGKKVELYIIIEHGDPKINIRNAQQIFVLNNKENDHSHFSRVLILIQIYFKLYKKDVRVFFARSSLTGVLPLVIANRLLNFNRSRIIFWSFGIDVVPVSFFPNKKNIKRLLSKIIVKIVFFGIDYLATGPEKMAIYYHKNFKIPKNKIVTLYNDISLKRFFPLSIKEKNRYKEKLISSRKKVILFVHTFNKSRGTDLLPLIALELKKKNIDAIIIAIGRPGDYSFELDCQISDHHLQDYLIDLGQIPNREIQKFYQICDLFIMPSRGEGFPRVLLEAMACKVPILAFDVGGVSEILDSEMQKEFLIPLNKSNRFIDQAITIIQNDELRNKLSNSAFTKVKSYSTENIVEMYVDVLNKI